MKMFIEKLRRKFLRLLQICQIVERRVDLEAMLQGSGIEIGALHRPCNVPHLDVKYVDRMTRDELLEQYPELKKYPIVETDIIDDAETLETISDNSQDFVIANHVIEHMRDPIRALFSWQRALNEGGLLFLAVPDKNITFDRERGKTEIAHLVEDYQDPSEERDREHFENFALYVSCRAMELRPEEEYLELAQELEEKDYSIHFHVWDCQSFSEFLDSLKDNFDNWKMRTIGKMETVGEEFIFLLKKKR